MLHGFGKQSMMYRMFCEDYANLVELKENLLKCELLINFVFIFMFGILIHGVIIFGDYVNHDTIALPTNIYSWLLVQGKWFVTPLSVLEGYYDIPYLSALIGLIFFSLSAILYSIIFNIKDKWLQRLIGGLFVSFPSVATMAIYHAMDYFSIAFFLSVLAGYLIIKNSHKISIIGTGSLCLTIGAYQPYLSVTMVILLFDTIVSILHNNEIKRRVINYFSSVFLSIALYFVILKIRLLVTGMKLSPYKGMNNLSHNLSPDILINSVYGAWCDYWSFFLMGKLNIYSLFSDEKYIYIIAWGIIVLYVSSVIITSIYSICSAAKGKARAVCVMLYIFIIPICANVAGVATANQSFYYITLAPFILVFTFPVVLHCCTGKNICKNVFNVTVVGLLLLSWFWIHENNMAYQVLKQRNRNVDYRITDLATKVKSLDGYSADKKIVFIGDAPFDFLKSEGLLKRWESELCLNGYGLGGGMAGMVYDYGILRAFFENRYATEFKIVHQNDRSYKNLININESSMSIYPTKGSIIVKDDIIYVKLSDNKKDELK